jgi:hypothetical protein
MSAAAETERKIIPASAAARFGWGLALTPIAGLIGFAFGLSYFIYEHPPPPSGYGYIPDRPPWWEEVVALFQLGLFTSLFSWPVTLVVFPLVRRWFPLRTWRAFGAIVIAALTTGFVGPIPALMFFALLRAQNAFSLEWFFPTLGSVSGFLTAIPYFLLTNPKCPR